MLGNLPYVTALYAALLGLLAAMLTINVIRGRGRFATTAGDGGHAELAQAIRAHANFVEQAPLALLVIGFAEASGTPKALVHALGIALLVGRLFSAFGLSATLADRLPRRIGAAVTLGTIIIASLAILARLAGLV